MKFGFDCNYFGETTITVTHKVTGVQATMEVYSYIEKDIRIYYDAGCEYEENEIRNIFQDVADAIYEQFYFKFNLTLVAELPELDGYMCIGESCNCHDRQCIFHHHSAERLLEIGSSPNIFTCRLVSHLLCYFREDINQHKTLSGAASLDRKNSVVCCQFDANLLKKVIIHELSHNLGAEDHEGVSYECIMSGTGPYESTVEHWCAGCRIDIEYFILDNYAPARF